MFTLIAVLTTSQGASSQHTYAPHLLAPDTSLLSQPPLPKGVPKDWESRAVTGWMLVGDSQPSNSELCPTIANGFVGATLCPLNSSNSDITGGTFLSGMFDGSCPAHNATSNARATLPSPQGVVGMGGNAEFVAMALDLENATVLRRWRVVDINGEGCDVEMAQYAHRSIRHLLVTIIAATKFVGTSDKCTLTPLLPNWATATGSCVPDNTGAVACNSTTVPETPRQTPTVVSVYANAVTETITLTSTSPSVTLLAAFATNLEPNVTGAVASTVAKRRWQLASMQTASQLAASHRAAWAKLWVPQLSIGGNATMTTALRSSLYYVLSSVRDDWAFGSTPGGLPSTSYHGHAFRDMETWFFPPLAVLYVVKCFHSC